VIDLPEEQKQGLKWIGEKSTERLRFEKPHVYVEVIKRPQYVVPGRPAEGVKSMPPPLAIVEGGKYDFSVVAALKFAFHVPTYRQQDWFAQCGWFPRRSTVNDLLNYAVRSYNVFHWSLTHQNAEIDGHLATYRGVFVGDACGANARLQERSGGRIIHASCNAHARREFVEAESNDPLLASQGLSFYRQLYDVEERGKTLDAAARGELRQRDAAPVWDHMRRWLDSDALQRVLPQSAIGKALGYLRNQWSALRVYLGDGRIPIDNDQSEQILRPLTVGRNNWLFLGHPRAATGRLQMYSVVSSAHRHHLVVEDYLEDVLRRLADAQQNHPADLAADSPYLLDLLPDRWAVSHPQSVRRGRIEEREVVSDAKRWRRAQARLQARAPQTIRAP